jgi:hopanoid biosynthesis associated RND transporter like protein HpnN
VLNASIGRTVDFCIRHARAVILLAVILGVGAAGYAAQHFTINTDISKLISSDLPWRQRQLAFQQAFPDRTESILAVVHAPTPELASAARNKLLDELLPNKDLFRSVHAPDGGNFFERNFLLYLSTEDLGRTTQGLTAAGPLIRTLAGDPSMRGILDALTLSLKGVQMGRISLDDLSRPLNMGAETVEDALSNRPPSFSWRVLMSGKPPAPLELRRLINVWPVLDYNALQPGAKATAAIREAAAKANLASDYNADVRLTGTVPIADEEFATLQEGSLLNGVLTGAIVLLILWLALRSLRTVLAVVVSLPVALAVTAALGLMLVGALNPISVAFAVLCVGLGADFAIQFSVRYRAARHENNDLYAALLHAADRVGAPLTLAAGAAAAGFLSFMPTSYKGLAELGLIAGCGMVVAYVTSMTLLPALLRALNPPEEPQPLGYAALAPADHFLQRHRIAVVAITSCVALAGLPLLVHLRFEFDPLKLRNPNTESVATYLELSKDPMAPANTAQVLVGSSTEAAAVAKRLSELPEVAQTRTLDSFIPEQQDEKLPLITNAGRSLNTALNPGTVKAAPTDAEKITALREAAKTLREAAGESSGPGAQAAIRLEGHLTKLAEADASLRANTETAFVWPLKLDLDDLRQALRAQRITRATLPRDLVQDWVAKDGRERVEATPKGDPNDSETLRQFTSAVLAVEPRATGQAIDTIEWGSTILSAFIQAGAWSLASITILLWIVLRRFSDVMLTLVPLLVAAAVTLEICALFDFALNYANIIALPVLLGVGVAFKIYYVIEWRRGQVNFLQSSLTRAVIFSALMTATAFGSLWLSSHPGMSSMGKLLALSLLCTLAAAALYQPALMGPPRRSTLGFAQAPATETMTAKGSQS